MLAALILSISRKESAYEVVTETSIAKSDWWYFLPAIKFIKTNKYFEFEFDFLILCVYYSVYLKDVLNDES